MEGNEVEVCGSSFLMVVMLVLGVLDKKANKVNMFVAAAGMNWKREEKFKNVK